MPVDGQVLSVATALTDIWLIFKIGFIVFAGLYFLFSLIIIRQVYLMTETLITEVSHFIRAFSIIHAGLALGILILFIGFL
ncbi:hypothetical protein HY389_02225 [Candidatus Daviesbacteria bacterium]|nr:hypothetical protein [Candidatus Daviesbacteria bacterium]